MKHKHVAGEIELDNEILYWLGICTMSIYEQSYIGESVKHL